jgi:hypothetical protein
MESSGTVAAQIGSEIRYSANSKVELISGNYSNSTRSEADGSFKFEGIPELTAGYTLRIYKDNYLTKILKYDILNSNMEISTKNDPALLLPGDIGLEGTQDGVINMSDIMSMAYSFNTAKGDPRYSSYKDFNEDGAINLADIMIVAQNFNKTA